MAKVLRATSRVQTVLFFEIETMCSEKVSKDKEEILICLEQETRNSDHYISLPVGG